jgi:hypothetical protein
MHLFINGINLFPFIFLFFLIFYSALSVSLSLPTSLLLHRLLNHLDFRNIRILPERQINLLLSVYPFAHLQQIEKPKDES